MMLFCTGCRAEISTDFLRTDQDGYFWCQPCKPALWVDPKPSESPVAARKRRSRTGQPSRENRL